MDQTEYEKARTFEDNVLGMIISDESLLITCIEMGIKPAMFETHKDIISFLMNALSTSTPIDLPVLCKKFPTKSGLLIDLESCYIGSSLDYKGSILQFKLEYQIKTIEGALRWALDEVSNRKPETTDDFDKMLSKIVNSLIVESDKGPEKFSEIASRQRDILVKRIEGKDNTPLLLTGNKALDMALGTYCTHKYISITAPTGIGKSTFALDIATNMAMRGRKIGYFSSEMTNDELFEKDTLMRAGVSPDEYHTPTYIEDAKKDKYLSQQIERIENQQQALSDLPIWVYDASSDIDQILLHAKRLRIIYHIDAVFIDYIQQLEILSYRSPSQRVEIVNQISRKCLQFGRKENIPIFIIAQLTRKHDECKNPLDLIDFIADSSGISKDTTYGLALKENGENRLLYRTKARHGNKMLMDNIAFNSLTGRYTTDY